MKERIFLDTDVILDLVLERKPYCYDSQRILSLIERDEISGYTSALVLANCYYIISRNRNKATAVKVLAKLRSILTILSVTDKDIGESLSSGFKDFEDGVQYFIAVNNGVNTIITRNIADYKSVDMMVFLPGDFLILRSASR